MDLHSASASLRGAVLVLLAGVAVPLRSSYARARPAACLLLTYGVALVVSGALLVHGLHSYAVRITGGHGMPPTSLRVSRGPGELVCLIGAALGLTALAALLVALHPTGKASHWITGMSLREGSLDLLLLGCATLVAVGSLGVWEVGHWSFGRYTFPPGFIPGSDLWSGQGWITLLLAVLIATTTVLAVATRWLVARVVVASLFATATIVVAISLATFHQWYPNVDVSTSPGWAAWLCLGASIVGALAGAPRIAQSWKRRPRTPATRLEPNPAH